MKPEAQRPTMTPDSIRLAIANKLGYKGCICPSCEYRKAKHLHQGKQVFFFEDYTTPEHRLPNWTTNLNDCFRMEETLTEDEGGYFEEQLEDICQKALELSGSDHWLRFKVCHATPVQRCEAFLRTFNLWTDDER